MTRRWSAPDQTPDPTKRTEEAASVKYSTQSKAQRNMNVKHPGSQMKVGRFTFLLFILPHNNTPHANKQLGCAGIRPALHIRLSCVLCFVASQKPAWRYCIRPLYVRRRYRAVQHPTTRSVSGFQMAGGCGGGSHPVLWRLAVEYDLNSAELSVSLICVIIFTLGYEYVVDKVGRCCVRAPRPLGLTRRVTDPSQSLAGCEPELHHAFQQAD